MLVLVAVLLCTFLGIVGNLLLYLTVELQTCCFSAPWFHKGSSLQRLQNVFAQQAESQPCPQPTTCHPYAPRGTLPDPVLRQAIGLCPPQVDVNKQTCNECKPPFSACPEHPDEHDRYAASVDGSRYTPQLESFARLACRQTRETPPSDWPADVCWARSTSLRMQQLEDTRSCCALHADLQWQ